MNPDHIFIRLDRSLPSHRTFSIHFFDRQIVTTVTHRASEVRHWLHRTRRFYSSHLHHLIAGLGVQWRPKPSRASPDPPPATIQLCIGRRCLVFQLIHAPHIPPSLQRFLARGKTTFVGVMNHQTDRRKLFKHLGLKIGRGREVRTLARIKQRRSSLSMGALAAAVLGYEGVEKPRTIGRSDWEARDLSDEQVQYAAVDAYLAFRLGMALLQGKYHC